MIAIRSSLRGLATATLALAIAAPSTGSAQQSEPVTLDALRERIAEIENLPGLGRGQIAVCVVDVAGREVILARNAQRAMAPASVLKVVTSAAGLARLGPEYTWKTHLQTVGTVNDQGVLDGTLILKGSGDPTLGSWRFEADGFPGLTAWTDLAAKAVADAGIKTIQGDVLADASIFSDQLIPDDWTWDDIGNYYAAGVAGVNLHENLYHLDFQIPNRQGDPTTITDIRPAQTGVAFHNRVTAGPPGSGDHAYIYSTPYAQLAIVRGTLPSDAGTYSIRGAIQDPALFAARELVAALNRAGIEVTGKPAGTFQQPRLGEGERNTLWTHTSPPLSRVAFWLNKQSVNLFAEAVTLTLAVEEGRTGTTNSGTQVTVEILESLGVDTAGMILADGSGLSRRNAVTARQVCSILERMTAHPSFPTFFDSLPAAGVPDDPSSFSSLGVDTPAANNLRAKSGFIGHVRAYAGYVEDASGRQLAFCLIANGFPGSSAPVTNAFKDLMVDLARLTDKEMPAP
ncbi:MAG: D-alanyl-D-alanine carboxypeptidase/D-alanyl-D-alanine-endopeptidase [Phycisphaeraceae bacterium]